MLKLQGVSYDETIEVHVFDVLGRQVHTAKGSATELYQFGQNFEAGVYLISIDTNEVKKVLRVIKE